MLETVIKNLTVAVEANTAALTGGTAAVPVAPTAADAFADVPAPVAAPTVPAAVVTVEAPAPAAALTKKTLTEKFIELAQDKGREVATALLAEYGVGSLPELKDKAQWPAFYAACEAKLV